MKKLIVFMFLIVLLGSCEKDIEGCTDATAVNYNPDANIDNTTCQYVPTLSTSPVININATSAESGGIISSDGGSDVTLRGLCWGKSPNPTITADDTTINSAGTGNFNSIMINLDINSIYYVRAYATSSNGTGYGNEFSFSTQNGIPVLNTNSVSNLTFNSASSGGEVLSDGGMEILSRGVCWSTTPIPTIANDTTLDGLGIGIFSSLITGLQSSTLYYLRAYATTYNGVFYGNELSFNTPLALGDTYQGGIIFYFDGNGGGLIAAPSDQSTGAEWGCIGTLISGADDLVLGAGAQNTAAIVAGCTSTGTAADICANLTLGGYSDWYLPSLYELGEMLNFGIIPFPNITGYWTSTHYDSQQAYCLNSIGPIPDYKNLLYRVRAIRSF